MKTFKGTLDDLKALVAATGRAGDWVGNNKAEQFRCNDGAILNWFPNTGTVQYQGDAAAKKELEEALSTASAGIAYSAPRRGRMVAEPAAKPKVFVVHGHDVASREQLELVLHKLGLDPFVLANTSGGGLTIIEALEREIGLGDGKSRFGIVLLTPDDLGYSKTDGPTKAEPRARQNVVLEMGMLLSVIGRPNVAILKRGHLEVPSDANGIIYLAFNDHVKEIVPKLAERLQRAGFSIDAAAIANASA